MAAIVVSSITNNFLPIAKTSPQRISLALWPTGGNAGEGAKAQNALLGGPDFIVYGTTDTTTNGTAIDLTAQGVTFPDGTQRIIVAKARIADDNGQGLVETKAIVDGGATPIVVTDSADADPLVSGLAGTPTLILSVSTANVILSAVGILDVDCRWVIEVYVGDAIPLAYIPTT
jgi:hypothetical protein